MSECDWSFCVYSFLVRRRRGREGGREGGEGGRLIERRKNERMPIIESCCCCQFRVHACECPFLM